MTTNANQLMQYLAIIFMAIYLASCTQLSTQEVQYPDQNIQYSNKENIIGRWVQLSPKLGVDVQDLDTLFGIYLNTGALVARTVPDSTADRMGIEVGDIIKKVNGNHVTNSEYLVALVQQSPIGIMSSIEVTRSGETLFLNGVMLPSERPVTPRTEMIYWKDGRLMTVSEGESIKGTYTFIDKDNALLVYEKQALDSALSLVDTATLLPVFALLHALGSGSTSLPVRVKISGASLVLFNPTVGELHFMKVE